MTLALLLPLCLVAAPSLAELVAGVCLALLHARTRKATALGERAGPWLCAQIEAGPLNARLRAVICPDPLPEADGYWPDARTITLRRATWADESAAGRAIACHELGHALTCAEDPAWGQLSLRARSLANTAWDLGAAALLVSLLLGWAPGPWLAGLAWLVSALSGAVALADEARASQTGKRALADLPVDAKTHANALLLGAFSVYAAGWLVRLAVIFALPYVAAHPEPVTPLIDLGLSRLLVWCLAPVLALRALAVLDELIHPPSPVDGNQLALQLEREQRWAGNAALVLLAQGLAMRGHAPAHLLAPLAIAACVPAMPFLGALARGLALLPPLVGLALTLPALKAIGVKLPTIPEPPACPRPPDATELVGACLPPWWSRAAQLSWAPFALAAAALSLY